MGVRRPLQVGLSIALALAFWAAPAAGAVLDAGCPGPRTGSHSSTTPDGRDAQTFTAIHTGMVTRAQIEINKLSPSTDFHLQILATNASGVPINGVLGSATIPDASVPLGVTTLDGTFSSPAPVVAGQTYALVVTRPGGSNYPISERGDDACPGQEFTSNFQTGTFGPSDPAFAHIFQVFVELPTPPPTQPPSNQFSFGKVKKNKKKGTAKLTIEIDEGPGELGLGKTKKVKADDEAVEEPGPTEEKLAINAKGKAKRKLRRDGKAKLKAEVTYTPTGGEPNTQLKRIKLVKK